MSLSRYRQIVRDRNFPRVSGDEPLEDIALECLDEFSPRERG